MYRNKYFWQMCVIFLVLGYERCIGVLVLEVYRRGMRGVYEGYERCV